MRKFECECGNKTFFLSRDKSVAKCDSCFKEYFFLARLQGQSGWVVRRRLLKRIIGFALGRREEEGKQKEQGKEFETKHFETIGELRKRLGVAKTKRARVVEKKPFWLGFSRRKEDRLKWFLYSKWHDLILELKAKGVVEFKSNDHFGSLRGKDIVKRAHTDLKKLGLDTVVSWHGSGGRLQLKDKDKTENAHLFAHLF